MSVVAQLVEHRFVVPAVASSILVDRPILEYLHETHKFKTNVPLVISLVLPDFKQIRRNKQDENNKEKHKIIIPNRKTSIDWWLIDTG